MRDVPITFSSQAELHGALAARGTTETPQNMGKPANFSVFRGSFCAVLWSVAVLTQALEFL
jgi:hypothetical protein